VTRPGYRACAFGVCWHADLPLPEFFEADTSRARGPHGEVCIRSVAFLADREALHRVNRGIVCRDGIRFPWEQEIVFDMFDGKRIEYLPMAGGGHRLPASFYGTVAAITLAWRGAVPIHASAVEVDGLAFLIAGPSGAGKSSLAAGLIAVGARLVSDDLTVVWLRGNSGAAEVYPGRAAMRQHSATASLMAADLCVPVTGDPRRKWLVRPVARTSAANLPLGGILLLANGGPLNDRAQHAAMLGSNLFRPRWLAALPSHGSIRRDLLAIGATVPMAAFPAVGMFDPLEARNRAEQALEAIAAMARSRSGHVDQSPKVRADERC